MSEEAGAGCPAAALSESSKLSNRELEEVFAAARSGSPVTYLADIDFWAVTRYGDIKAILADRETYSASIALDPIQPFSPAVKKYLSESDFSPKPNLVPNDDREHHARIRKHTQIGFGPRQLKGMGPKIRKLADSAIDGFIDEKPVDLVEKMLYELPAIVLFLVLGIDDEDVGNIKRWADNRLLLTFGRLSEKEQLAAAKELVDYWHYSIAHVRKKRGSPGDDLPSTMLAARSGDDAALSEDEIANVVFGLLLAGHETTTNLSANAVLALLENRDAWLSLVANPDSIGNAVEELIRFRPPAIAWRRKTKEAVEIAGTTIPAGEKLLLMLAAGNRDEAVFSDPDMLEIGRENARSHISFGFGAHFCLGAPLARLELKVILEQLTKRLPDMRLDDRRQSTFVETIVFRGPKELWVTW